MAALCDRIVFLARGTVVGTGSPVELMTETGRPSAGGSVRVADWIRRRAQLMLRSMLVVARKELRDVVRDRRSLFSGL